MGNTLTWLHTSGQQRMGNPIGGPFELGVTRHAPFEHQRRSRAPGFSLRRDG
jgi:hypothetical protein